MTKLTLTEYKDCLLNDFELSGVAKLTCLILIEHLNRKTGNCYPSIDRIAEKASFTYNTIAKAITELSEKQYIKIEKKRLSGAKGISNFYSFPNLLPPAFEGRNEGRSEVTSEVTSEAAIEPSEFDGKPIEPIEPIKLKNKIKNDGFEVFYSAYPKKKSRGDAEKAFTKVIKQGTTLEEILLGVENYKKDIIKNKTEMKFVKHPSSFLNQQCWKDAYSSEPPKAAPDEYDPENGKLGRAYH